MPNYIFNNPIQKKNKCFISNCSKNIKLSLNEIKIKNVKKMLKSDGYIIYSVIPSIDINTNSIYEITKIDNDAYGSIVSNNDKWFNNKLDINEIDALYNFSFDSDDNTIELLLSSVIPTNIIINNNIVEDINVLINFITDYRNLNNYIINVDIIHYGIFFYPKFSCNKWLIKTINISLIDDCNNWNKKEIEDQWNDDIIDINNSINNEINRLENIKKKINNLFMEIKSTDNVDNNWEFKINNLKKFITDPNNKILSIYDNR